MIQPQPITASIGDTIGFDHLKSVFLPKLREFIVQKEALKKQKNKNEKAFEGELKAFLKHTFYNEKYIGNRPYKKGEADLVIADTKTATSQTSVLMEVKSPLDKKDFISLTDVNKKSFHQAITYFLIEIIERQNFGIKTILITDTDTYFLFDAMQFHQLFYKTALRKDFDNWYSKSQSGTATSDFYQQIDNFIANDPDFTIESTVLDLSTDNILTEINAALQETDIHAFNETGKFVEVKQWYRFFSPYILQKEKVAKDNNELNHRFYYELLHILGLKEYQKNGIKLIDRLPKSERLLGSFIENAIEKIIYERPKYLLPEDETIRFSEQEGDFDIALELCIIWINRILFLKLLEGQLQKYHDDKTTFQFLTPDILKNGNRLAILFFHVLNTPITNRHHSLHIDFEEVPFLNSGLFQLNYVEMLHGRISGLRDDLTMPVFKSTVLQDAPEELQPLNYLLQFLGAYNFGAPEKQEVTHQTKDLINASVLGKIFEKLNGYKDGSFYTPSYITMYMSQKVVRKAIVNKFNEKYHLNFASFEEVKRFTSTHYKIEAIKAFNEAINEITVCDPAVGSGHFLVSVLNELIAAKSELQILYDNNNQPLQYRVEVENDELKLTHLRFTDLNFEYKVTYKHGIRTINPDIQKVQTTLFREKQQIIENCLFGVDVNANSVQICRLRLWIELLKNAYYSEESNFKRMEILPNLDYKVVQGNSLIPVYDNQPVLIDWKKKYPDNIWQISSRVAIINDAISAIKTYKRQHFSAHGDERKRNLSYEINRAKADLLTAKFEIEIIQLDQQIHALDPKQRIDQQLTKKEDADRKELLAKKAFLYKIKREIDYSPDLGKQVILFDWNVDFAEIIGTFEHINEGKTTHGFDVIIGNPPYIQNKRLAYISDYLRQLYQSFAGISDISVCFFEKGLELLKPNGQLAFINSNKFWISEYGKPLRQILTQYNNTEFINLEQVAVFDEALVSSAVFHIEKNQPEKELYYAEFYKEVVKATTFRAQLEQRKTLYLQEYLSNATWIFNKPIEDELLAKIKLRGDTIDMIDTIEIRMGVKTGFDDAFFINNDTYLRLATTPDAQNIFKPLLRGKDIHKYHFSFKNIWLAYIPWHFPLQDDSTITRSSKKAEEAFELQYPEIYKHLKQYQAALTERSKAETGIRYEWYALQRFGNSFYHFFEKEKIVWGLISGIWGFAYDDKGHFLSSASYFLISEKIPLKFLLALFNSRLFQFYFDRTGEYTAGGAYVLKKKNIEKMIIPTDITDYQPFIELVDAILTAQNLQATADELENKLNQLIYQLYNINADEQRIIENTLTQRKLK
jgi:adenine-specific DNA-methyltransferase